MSSKPIKQHIVPRFYLKNFCNPFYRKKPKIWTFSKQRKPFEKNISKTAIRSNFYTLTDFTWDDKFKDKLKKAKSEDDIRFAIEEILSFIEGGAKAGQDQLLAKNLSLNEADKINFATFIWFMFVRTPFFTNRLEEMEKTVIDRIGKISASNKKCFHRSINEMMKKEGKSPLSYKEIEEVREFALSDRYNLIIHPNRKLLNMINLGVCRS